MTIEERYQQLERKHREAELGGGAERIQQQHQRGKMTARERVHFFLDEGSFVEIDKFVTHRCSEFGMEDKKFLGDGVIAGSARSPGDTFIFTRRTLRSSADHCPA